MTEWVVTLLGGGGALILLIAAIHVFLHFLNTGRQQLTLLDDAVYVLLVRQGPLSLERISDRIAQEHGHPPHPDTLLLVLDRLFEQGKLRRAEALCTSRPNLRFWDAL